MGILSDIADTISERLDPGTIMQEMGDGLDKMISQGAAEVGQALFSNSNAYMPYGPTQTSLDVADAAPAMDTAPVEAPEVQAPEPPAASELQSYEQMLDSYAPPSAPVQEQETEMER